MKKIRSTTGVIHLLKPRERGDHYITACGMRLKRPRNVEEYRLVDCARCQGHEQD